jgi:hypothetical protein
MRNKVKAAVVATVLGAGVLAVPTPALASSGGCRYPQVCVYQGSHITGRFRQVTGGWQWLGRSFGAHTIRNTRHDDVAYGLTTDGRVFCIRPGRTGGMMNGGFTAIRISYRSTC